MADSTYDFNRPQLKAAAMAASGGCGCLLVPIILILAVGVLVTWFLVSAELSCTGC